MPKPQSESEFVWKQIKFLLTLPYLLLLIIFKKKRFSELFNPIRDLVRFVLEPKVTFTLILLNIVMFLLEIFYFTEKQLMQMVFRPEHLYSLDFFPIVTSWFVHGSLAHLFGNMLFLFIFGRVVERKFGAAWTLLIYFISAIISSAVAAYFGTGGIGASGAIAGLISTAILIDSLYLTYVIIGIPLPIILVGFIAMATDVTNILVPAQYDNINHFAHLGGYLAVLPILFIMRKDVRAGMKRNTVINLGLVLIIVGMRYFGVV